MFATHRFILKGPQDSAVNVRDLPEESRQWIDLGTGGDMLDLYASARRDVLLL